MLSGDRRMPFDSWNLSEPQGNDFGNPRPMFASSQTPYQGILHSTTPSASGAVPVQVSAGRPVARGEERIGSTTTMPMPERRSSTMNSFLPAEVSTEIFGWTAKTRNIGASVREIHHSIIILHWKVRFKAQVSSCSDGRHVMGKRSGDGRFSG